MSSLLTLVTKPGFHNHAVVTQFNRRYFAVMEFMKGITLENLQADEMSRRFGEGGHLLEGGKKMLRELGQLAAFDLLTNNSDRIPLLSVCDIFAFSCVSFLLTIRCFAVC